MAIPIFDGHLHLIGEDGEEYLATVLRTMDRHGVARAVVFGVHGDPTSRDDLARWACALHPDRFVPFACDVDITDPEVGEQVAGMLAAGPWHGLGEIFVTTKKPDTEYLLRSGEELHFTFPQPPRGPLDASFRGIFEACAHYGQPVLVHCDDTQVMEQLLSLHRDTTFIWGHADWSQDDWTAERLLQRLASHPNLYYEVGACLRSAAFWADSQWYLPDWYAGWVPVMEQYPGRITFGSDPYDWRHLEPEAHADCLYAPAREVEARLSAEAAHMWLGGALARLLGVGWAPGG